MNTKSCVVVSAEYMLRARIHHFYNRVKVFEQLKYQSLHTKYRISCEMDNHLFETYKNSFVPHGEHIFKTYYDIYMATMCAYPSSKYA